MLCAGDQLVALPRTVQVA
ncbi:MAG: hypothetical protein WDN49_25360 [Acetobacteraceae bacterium]